MFQSNKIIKSLAFIFGVVALSIGLGYVVLAWVEPGSAPPGCVSGTPGCDAPLNVSDISQTKKGSLVINEDGAPTGLIVYNDAVFLNGNVGIGIATPPAAKLDVSGIIKIGSDATACGASIEGALRYNSALQTMEFCNGTNWMSVTGSLINPASNWITGNCDDLLEGVGKLEVYKEDNPSLKKWKTTATTCNIPQCNDNDPSLRDNLVALNTVNFSEYPARDACKVNGGRLPTKEELSCIADNRAFYGVYGSFGYYPYFSSTEKEGGGVNTNIAYARYIFPTGSFEVSMNKTSDGAVRCVK